jgi:hypothetical protein
VSLPEHPQQIPVGDLLGVEDDENDFRVSGSAAADLPVSRVWREASCVTDGGRVDAVNLPELPLGAPETTEAEDRCTQTLGKGWLKGRAKYGVPLRKFERRPLPARKRLGLQLLNPFMPPCSRRVWLDVQVVLLGAFPQS